VGVSIQFGMRTFSTL